MLAVVRRCACREGTCGEVLKASRWQSASPSMVDCELQHLNTTASPFVQMCSTKLHSGENKGRNMKL